MIALGRKIPPKACSTMASVVLGTMPGPQNRSRQARYCRFQWGAKTPGAPSQPCGSLKGRAA